MVDIHALLTAFQLGQLEVAEDIARKILAVAPNQLQASLILGNVLLRRNAAGPAEQAVAAALSYAPGHAELLNLHGVALANLGRKEEAFAAFDKAIERRINFPAAHQNLSALLAERRDPTPRFGVTVVTPTVGTPLLEKAIESVQSQDYPLLEHLVVADGPKYTAKVRGRIPATSRYPIHFMALPINLGAGGYCGHRFYGAAPYLVNSRFVAYLDEDNTFDADHISSLMGKITAQGLSWAYALRKIFDQNGNLVTCDDCESLGQWATWNNPNVHLVDVSCYMFRRDLALATSPLWYRRAPDEENPDFAVCMQLLREKHPCGTNGRHTVNYRAGTEDGRSVSVQFFLRGNEVMKQRYGERLPWRAG